MKLCEEVVRIWTGLSDYVIRICTPISSSCQASRICTTQSGRQCQIVLHDDVVTWKMSPLPATVKEAGPRFHIKMSSYQYRKSHCGDKTVVRSSDLHNGISYTGKMTSLYGIGAQLSHIILIGQLLQVYIIIVNLPWKSVWHRFWLWNLTVFPQFNVGFSLDIWPRS